MTPDDIIAVIERGMCHSADKAAECDVCATKRRAIAEVRTGREQLLAALAGIAERDAEIERLRALHDQVAAMKLRALAAHEAIWRATNGRPSDAVRALMDDGEVHEAVHAIIAVETQSVSAPEEWRAHVERQDRRIEALEAERVELHAEADRWRDAARKLGKENAALRAELASERLATARLVVRHNGETIDLERELARLRAEHAACVEALGIDPPDTLLAACERVGKGAPRLMTELSRLRARDERTARVIEIGVGDCPTGIDALVRELHPSGVLLSVFRADWQAFGKRAGPERNARMVAWAAETGGMLLACPGPRSRGTWDCVRRARAAGLSVGIKRVGGAR